MSKKSSSPSLLSILIAGAVMAAVFGNRDSISHGIEGKAEELTSSNASKSPIFDFSALLPAASVQHPKAVTLLPQRQTEGPDANGVIRVAIKTINPSSLPVKVDDPTRWDSPSAIAAMIRAQELSNDLAASGKSAITDNSTQ